MVMYGNGNIPEDDVLEMVGKEVIEIREKRKEDEENYNLCAPILEDIKTLDDLELQKALIAEITDEFLQKYKKRDYHDTKQEVQFEDKEKLA